MMCFVARLSREQGWEVVLEMREVGILIQSQFFMKEKAILKVNILKNDPVYVNLSTIEKILDNI